MVVLAPAPKTAITWMAIIKKFLIDVCGFTDKTSKEITTNQGYKDLDKFYPLKDKGIDTLCSIVKKAQGSVSGIAISNLAQECLKLAIFAMRYYKCCYCKINIETMTKKDIIGCSQQHKIELFIKNKLVGHAQATFKDLAKTFEWVLKQLVHAWGADDT